MRTLGKNSLHSFQSLVSPPAAVNFSSPAGRFGLRGCHSFCAAILLFTARPIAKAKTQHTKTKTSPAPCVCNIGRIRIRTSCSYAPTLSSARRTARHTSVCKPFRCAALFASTSPTLAQGCITCVVFFSTHRIFLNCRYEYIIFALICIKMFTLAVNFIEWTHLEKEN